MIQVVARKGSDPEWAEKLKLQSGQHLDAGSSRRINGRFSDSSDAPVSGAWNKTEVAFPGARRVSKTRLHRGGIAMKKFSLVAFVLFVFAAATVAQDVRYNFAQDLDFSRFKTYKSVELKHEDAVDSSCTEQKEQNGNAPAACLLRAKCIACGRAFHCRSGSPPPGPGYPLELQPWVCSQI